MFDWESIIVLGRATFDSGFYLFPQHLLREYLESATENLLFRLDKR